MRENDPDRRSYTEPRPPRIDIPVALNADVSSTQSIHTRDTHQLVGEWLIRYQVAFSK